MISNQKTKKKEQVLKKYLEEQSIRRGGDTSNYIAVGCAALSLKFYYSFVGVRSRPYLGFLLLMSYLGA